MVVKEDADADKGTRCVWYRARFRKMVTNCCGLYVRFPGVTFAVFRLFATATTPTAFLGPRCKWVIAIHEQLKVINPALMRKGLSGTTVFFGELS